MHTRIEPVGDQPQTWEAQYKTLLINSGRMSSEALAELTRCTDSVLARLAPIEHRPALIPGVVVGAVQSGKTALMLNLAARGLDTGFKVVVVLAGLRDDLRTQTALRYSRDLLQRGDPVAPGTYTHPKGPGYHGARKDCWTLRFDEDVNHDEAFLHLFQASILRGTSALVVTKKHVATLTRVRDAYERVLRRTQWSPMLVLDDECDEASVSGDPEAPTPERIAQLWEGLGQYVGYV